MRTICLTCVVMAFIALPSISQNKLAGMNVIVLKPDGQPMAGAFVAIRDYRQTGQGNVSDSWESRTVADGSVVFAVPKGCYDILVSANFQSLPLAQRLCASSGNLALRITLKADLHPLLLLR